MVFDPWFETVLENGVTAPPAWDVMLSQHNHEVEVETDDNDPVGATLSDDWLTKEELAKKQCDDDVKSAWKQAKPTAKQEGVRAPSNSFTHQQEVSVRPERAETVSEGANDASEGAIHAPERASDS